MEEEITISNYLPFDISFKLVSSLPARDVCALGSCSRFWRALCGSDLIWVTLSKKRWPSLTLSDDHQFAVPDTTQSFLRGWKAFYMKKHHEMADRTSTVIKFVEQCSSSTPLSLEVRDYLKAIEELRLLQLDFKDVELFLFKPELSVLLNLVGLHYCINWLGVPPESVIGALQCSKISERQVSIKWWKLGRWFHGFRLRDESHHRLVSLADIVTDLQEEVLKVLCRGAVYEVIRVQISTSYPLSGPWTCHSSA